MGAGFMNNTYRFLTFVGFALPFLLTNKKKHTVLVAYRLPEAFYQ